MSFNHYLALFLTVLVDRVDTFRRMKVAFLTIFKAVITTIQLKNTSFANISYSYQTFASHFLQQTQHLVPDQSSLHFQILD